MTGYTRPDGLEMVAIAPHEWVNRAAGERLGLVARASTAMSAAAEPAASPPAHTPTPTVPVPQPVVSDPMAGAKRYATLLFRLGNSLAEVIRMSGLTREVAIECRKSAARA